MEGAMTPLDAVFSLPEETILDEDTMGRILKSGHTRIPVTRKARPWPFYMRRTWSASASSEI